MGLSFSSPKIHESGDSDSHLSSKDAKDGGLGSTSFNGCETVTCNSREILFEMPLSFKERNLETRLSFSGRKVDAEAEDVATPVNCKKMEIREGLECSRGFSRRNPQKELREIGSKQYEAALKLQKVYKSFRTRRRLADCAVLVEQRWWKLLDFAELKRSSISFFDIEKPETAVSRWSRARTKAAKVGKGLSKDEKARQLALQHWLEAIDPRHRYGHNLQFYYVAWLHCDSNQPFFYWLDIGEGKEVNLERCSRSKLQQQCIKYLGPTEREAYEAVVEDGKLVYKQSRKVLDTRGGTQDIKWIFVLSVTKILYVGKKEKGRFQHSSFLAGGATLSAGRLVVENGIIKAVWPHSGHYLPTEENFEEFMLFLKEHDIDLTNVQKSPAEEDEEANTIKKLKSISAGPSMKDEGNSEYLDAEADETIAQNLGNSEEANSDPDKPVSNLSRSLCSKLARLVVPKRGSAHEIFRNCQVQAVDSPSEDGYETAEETFIPEEEFTYPKANLFSENDEDKEPISKEKIMKRIDSHKEMKSYQLARQLSSTWTTGAGPRISCMRDYPSELQFRVLEQANLSPRSRSANASPRTSRTSSRGRTGAGKSSLAAEQTKSLQPTTL